MPTMPDFFIIGAPKCGTTSLYHYFKDHPAIYMPSIKEPCYFADDFPDYRKIHSKQEYLDLFDGVKKEHQAVGEASVWYLYSEVAMRNIYDFNPEAKIITMIRNPVEVVYSLHSQNYYSNIDDEPDFERAWRLQDSRQQGKYIPSTCPAPEHLQYKKIARFGDQIERLFEIFPRDQVKIIVFDDFAERTEETFENTLNFLEIDHDFIPDLTPHNQSHKWKFPTLGKITTEIPRRLNFLLRPLKNTLGIHSFHVLSWLEQFNTAEEKRDPLPATFIKELRDTFSDDIDKTSDILDRDLTDWYKNPPDKLETGTEN